MLKRNTRWAALVGALLALSLLAAACGNDDSGTNGDDSQGQTPDETGNGDDQPSGEPLRVMNITATTGDLPYPQVIAAVEAAAAAINADGGVNGRPIEVVHCDLEHVTDPNPATQCARSLVEDETFLAQVGEFGGFGDVTNPILDDAGVASIGPFPLSASVLSAPNSFPLAASEGAALGLVLADNGIEDIRVAYIDIPAGSECVGLIDAFLGMGRGGMTSGGSVAVPLTATDIAPQVAAAAEGDGAVVCLSDPQTVQFLRTASEGGYDVPLSIPGLNVSDRQLELVAPYADGVYVAYGLPAVTSTDLPGIERFHEEMDRYAPDADRDETALNGWMSVYAFAIVASDIDGDITREAVLDAFSTHGPLDVHGLLPPDYDTTVESGVPGLNRLFSRYYRAAQIQDGQVAEIADVWIPQFEEPTS